MRTFLRRHRELLAYLALVIALLIGAYRLEVLARSTHEALCDLRADVERRTENTQRFLDDHPGPFPIAGITRSELERTLTAQRATLDALSDLNC